MHHDTPTLHFLCGKIAAGKSTLAARLAHEEDALIIVEDDWLSALFAEQLATLQDYARCTSKLRQIMHPHISALLAQGVSVVLDFSSNTVQQRKWMRDLVTGTGAVHQLHHLATPDEVCLARLHRRNAEGNHPFVVTEAQFWEFSKHFVPPSADEGFTITVHHHPA